MRSGRTPVSLALLALMTAASHRTAAQQFEGVVTIKTLNLTADIVADQTGEEELSDRGREKLFAMTLDQLVQISGSAHTNVLHVKGGRMRTAAFDMPGLGSTYMLLDVAGGMLRTVAPAKRGYYEAALRAPGGETEQADPMQIVALGRNQVIEGLRCTGYRVTQGGQVSHVWTTDDPAAKAMVANQLRMAGDDAEGTRNARALLARYGAPMMTQTFDEEGDYSVEVWSLERKSLPDSLFVVPSGYTKLRSPGG